MLNRCFKEAGGEAEAEEEVRGEGEVKEEETAGAEIQKRVEGEMEERAEGEEGGKAEGAEGGGRLWIKRLTSRTNTKGNFYLLKCVTEVCWQANLHRDGWFCSGNGN